jgi:glycerophosphoryl diester phosphodiesterase
VTPTFPRVIAHRGASGHRPEHTLAAYDLAFRLGADSVELDLLATRDGVVVCRHDLELSRTTDVADRPDLAHLRTTRLVDGRPVTGWFVHDLTYAQVRTLRCRERWPRKRPGSAAHDGREHVPTLAEVLELVAQASARAGRRLGVHLELKEPAHLASYGLSLPELLDGTAPPAATWMSFDATALRAVTAPGPKVLLVDDPRPRKRDIRSAAGWADGIAVRPQAVLPPDRDERVQRPSGLVDRAAALGLDVLVWTHRAENRHLPANLRVGQGKRGHGDAATYARMLYEAGVDGLVTDFPEIAVQARAGLAPDAAVSGSGVGV